MIAYFDEHKRYVCAKHAEELLAQGKEAKPEVVPDGVYDEEDCYMCCEEEDRDVHYFCRAEINMLRDDRDEYARKNAELEGQVLKLKDDVAIRDTLLHQEFERNRGLMREIVALKRNNVELTRELKTRHLKKVPPKKAYEHHCISVGELSDPAKFEEHKKIMNEADPDYQQFEAKTKQGEMLKEIAELDTTSGQ